MSGTKQPSSGSSQDEKQDKLTADQRRFHQEVDTKQRRATRARQEGDRTIMFGVGAFGMVGWSIAVPMLIGIVVGAWVDRKLAGGGVRFTLSFLVLGLIIGGLNVWKWMNSK